MYFSKEPVLSDFDGFLDYIGQADTLVLTKDKRHLRNADLIRLNDLMVNRIDVFNPKSQQSAFSLLNTFFHIGQMARLFLVRKDAASRKYGLVIAKDRVQQYDALSTDEKYFFLLQSFWCYVNWEDAYDCRAFWDNRFYLELLAFPVGEPVSIADRDLKRKGKIRAPVYLFAAEIFQAFGFFELVWDSQLEQRPAKYRFPYKSATLSGLGKAVLPVLFGARVHQIWGGLNPFFSEEVIKRIESSTQEEGDDFDDFEGESGGNFNDNEAPGHDVINHLWDRDVDLSVLEDPYQTAFGAAFLPAFPELDIKTSLYPIVHAFVSGQCLLNVSLSDSCYREISIGTEATLEDLHVAIQSIFEFDNDHLYVFFMDGKPQNFGSNAYFDPRGYLEENQNPAHVFKLGELGLYPGQEFLYLFDYGDNWAFLVRVLQIETSNTPSSGYKVLKTMGASPEQYPDADW